MSSLQKSIEHILIQDGEATARQISDKLGTNTTDVQNALKALFDADKIVREKIWSGKYPGNTYSYRHVNAPLSLDAQKESAKERARYVTCQGKRVGRLTIAMFDQVQRHGRDNNREMRIKGPDPGTADQRSAAKSQGLVLPATQFIRLDILKLVDGDAFAYALDAPNPRTVTALLAWYPEFRLGD